MKQLFSDRHITSLIRRYDERLRESVASMPADDVMDLHRSNARVSELVRTNTLRPPKIETDKVFLKSEEIVVDGRQGQRIVLNVPFTGDKGLLKYSPSARKQLPTPPRGDISDQTILFEITGVELAAKDIANSLNHFLHSLVAHLDSMERNCDDWNKEVGANIKKLVDGRRLRLKRHYKVLLGLSHMLKDEVTPIEIKTPQTAHIETGSMQHHTE